MKALAYFAIAGFLLIGPSLIHAQPTEDLIQQGDEYLLKRNYKKAQKIFQQAIRTNDRSSDAHRGLGDSIYYQLQVTRRTVEKAQKEYKKALELDPLNLKAQRGVAQCLLSFGEYDQAISTAKAVLQVDPTFADAQLTIAETYHRIARDHYYEEGVAPAPCRPASICSNGCRVLQRAARLPWPHR